MICLRLFPSRKLPYRILPLLRRQLSQTPKTATSDVILYSLKNRVHFLGSLATVGGTALAISGIVTIQKMIAVQLEAVDNAMVYRLGFVTVSAIALIILNAFAFKTVISLKYLKQLKQVELQRFGVFGIKQTIRLTPQMGSVTFVSTGDHFLIKHPESRVTHYMQLKLGSLSNENLYERLFRDIDET